jgi:NAD(P)-dependent dehydrogenase (short-subunit alcohol dehydrogenase family)
MQKTILITGANRGIGLEFVKQYRIKGFKIYATCRDLAQADELRALEKTHLDQIHVFELDVSNPRQIQSLAEELQNIPIDIVINNAGIFGGDSEEQNKLNSEEWLEVFRINSIAPIQVIKAFKSNIKKSQLKTAVSLTSKMGSIDDNNSGNYYYYRTSKAALNMAMKSLAIDYADYEIKLLSLHPGWVKTRMGGPNALIDTESSVRGMIQVIEKSSIKDSGKFLSFDGTEINW